MADKLDPQQAVASVYADSLFELARAAGQVDDVRSELEELVRLVELQPSFGDFLASSAIQAERRADGLEKMFRGKLSDLVLNTLLVMNRNGRTGAVAGLLRSFVLAQEEAAGEVEVTATSAVELDEAQRERVASMAAELSGRKPVVEYTVDPAILGGLVLQIGDLRFDHSVRRQLEQAQLQLAERGRRGLAVGVDDAG